MIKTAGRFFSAAAIVFISVILLDSVIFHFSDIRYIPSRLADIYREDQLSLLVPGSRNVQLNRTGAYGIYYQYSLVATAADSVQKPPALACTLNSESSQIIKGVADYEPTNRYWSNKGGGPATLIQSITVDESGEYTFECIYHDDSPGPEVMVSLGPNYTWEYIRLILKNGPAILGIMLSFLGGVVISSILVVVGIFQIKEYQSVSGKRRNHES